MKAGAGYRFKSRSLRISWEGRDAQIKQHLLHLLRRNGYVVRSEQISFGLIGKKSPAHELAIAVFRKEIQPNLILTVEDLLEGFPSTKKSGVTPKVKEPSDERPAKDSCS